MAPFFVFVFMFVVVVVVVFVFGYAPLERYGEKWLASGKGSAREGKRSSGRGCGGGGSGLWVLV